MGRNGRGWEKREPPRSDVDLMNDDETAPARSLSLGSRSTDADVYAVISQPYIVRPDGKDPPTGASASRRGSVCLPPCSPFA